MLLSSWFDNRESVSSCALFWVGASSLRLVQDKIERESERVSDTSMREELFIIAVLNCLLEGIDLQYGFLYVSCKGHKVYYKRPKNQLPTACLTSLM